MQEEKWIRLRIRVEPGEATGACGQRGQTWQSLFQKGQPTRLPLRPSSLGQRQPSKSMHFARFPVCIGFCLLAADLKIGDNHSYGIHEKGGSKPLAAP